MTRPVARVASYRCYEPCGDYGNRDKIPPVLVPHGQELEPETHAVCVAGGVDPPFGVGPAEICRRTFVRAARCPTTSLPVSVSTTACPIRFRQEMEKDKTAVEAEHKKASWAGLVRACRKLAMAHAVFDAPGEQARTADQRRWPRRYCAVRFATV